MKASFILCLYLLLLTSSGYSQDSTIVSLNLGNKWLYNYSSYRSSPSGSSYEQGIEIKEVVNDSILLYGKYYKEIFVISVVETDSTTYTEYWGLDSISFYFRSVRPLNLSGLNTFYDLRIDHDTTWSNIEVFVYQNIYWGYERTFQKWRGYFAGMADGEEETITAKGVGPIKIYSNGSVDTGGSEWTISITLKGALIDGVVYGDTTTVGIKWNHIQPNQFLLSQNYPNPFNPTTSIKYQIPEITFVAIKVYDVLGKEVATLVNEEKPAGNDEIEFNGTGFPSGIYFYQIQAGSFVETKKMVLMK